MKYLAAAVSGSLLKVEDMNAYFGELGSSFGSIGWHMAGLIITFAIMLLGVSKGIEKMNKLMMPVFFVFFLILMVRVFTLPGALEGYLSLIHI